MTALQIEELDEFIEKKERDLRLILARLWPFRPHN
jgi:hypothetical protein